MVTLPPGVGCWRWSWWRRWASAHVLRGSVCLRGGGALWRLLRGLWALCWVGWYTRQGWRRGGCMGVLHRFSDGWALVVLRGDGDGVGASADRVLAVDRVGGWAWLLNFCGVL